MLVLWPTVHLCACLSLAAFPQYCTDPDVSWGMEGGALWLCTIGRIVALGARVSLLCDNITSNTKCQPVLVLALCLVQSRILGAMRHLTITLTEIYC